MHAGRRTGTRQLDHRVRYCRQVVRCFQVEWLRSSAEHGEANQPLLAVNLLAALLAKQALHPIQRMDMMQLLDGYLNCVGLNEKMVGAPMPVTYSTCASACNCHAMRA